MINEQAIEELLCFAEQVSNYRRAKIGGPDEAVIWMNDADYGLFKTALVRYAREHFGTEEKPIGDAEKKSPWRAEFALGSTRVFISKKANKSYVTPNFQVTPMFPSIKIFT